MEANIQKLSFIEKVGYAFGDGAANIAWRGVATFLLIFYTDVVGLDPAVVGTLFLVARFGDGISDILMGILGDHTKSKYGKFRPWILWTAIPLGIILALLFTIPDFDTGGKIFYAYVTYILFTLIYTANNVPYGALMGVMTPNDKERSSLGSYRMAGAFAGGMLVQVSLLYLVATFGNFNPNVEVSMLSNGKYKVEVTSTTDIDHADLSTTDGVTTFSWLEGSDNDPTPTKRKSFSINSRTTYTFIAESQQTLTPEDIQLVDQKSGYSYAMYLMSMLLALLMLLTFYSTKERVLPPSDQKTDLIADFKNLFKNRPWIILLFIGLLFNIYNSIKQGIVIIYFTHYLGDTLLSASYLFGLGIASIAGAFATAHLSKTLGKRNLFIAALLLSGMLNALIIFCGQDDIGLIFTLGVASEFASAMFPTLFFVMLGDAADFSEWKDGRRATGLVYSAGSFATKLGGGIAGAIIGWVLSYYHYNGQNSIAIQEAFPAIKMLMSWIPSIVTIIAAGLMLFYPLTSKKMGQISSELIARRASINNQ